MSVLEQDRSILEELEVIEAAVSKRMERNPLVVPELAKMVGDEVAAHRRKRRWEEVLLQQHELKFLKDKYRRQCNKVLAGFELQREVFGVEIGGLMDPEFKFQLFDEGLEKIREKHRVKDNEQVEDLSGLYEMFSSLPELEKVEVGRTGGRKVKRKYILSAAASHIDLESLFSGEECFGNYVDLRQFYERYQTWTGVKESYVEFLSQCKAVKFNQVKRESPQYQSFLKDLTEYMVGFYGRVYPLQSLSELSSKIDDNFKSQRQTVEDGKPDSNARVFCAACGKNFAKETVYKGHLAGEKHKKNVKRQKQLVGGENNESNGIFHGVDYLEFKLKYLAKELKNHIDAKIAAIQRYESLTERERLIENDLHNDSDYTDLDISCDDNNTYKNNNDDDDDDDQFDYNDLPLGIDGKPIPFWLYKLQGYHKSYDCEICGNITYKGRTNFSKHFSNVKHQHGLKCLGITEDHIPLFKNITKIEEASDLWRRIKREQRIKQGDAENAVEVEDDQGNVLSEKDYLDLKKQGLL